MIVSFLSTDTFPLPVYSHHKSGNRLCIALFLQSKRSDPFGENIMILCFLPIVVAIALIPPQHLKITSYVGSQRSESSDTSARRYFAMRAIKWDLWLDFRCGRDVLSSHRTRFIGQKVSTTGTRTVTFSNTKHDCLALRSSSVASL